MKIDRNSVWVFDLDDTLYSEKQYQISGYSYITEYVNRLYNKDVATIIEEATQAGEDVLAAICEDLSLPEEVKKSLLWLYRLHMPDISLSAEVRTTLDTLKARTIAINILTDGRSISQRNKVEALGLDEFDMLVSEEWGETKPGIKRFQAIMDKYPLADAYVYVGDNINKDFVAPNKMGWITIGLKDSGDNIHSQEILVENDSYLPQIWVNSISEVEGKIC